MSTQHRLAQHRVTQFLNALETTTIPQAWISTVPPDDLRAAAAELDRRLTAGEHLPLGGLLFAVKDNIDVAGLPTTAGHPAAAYTPTAHAPAVTRLLEAGALVVGKTAMDQFATGLTGTRSPHGPVPSAQFPLLLGGGSSSGSGAVVGQGIVDFALATDTAGSGRVPAAFNQVIGLKPTRGLVPTTGVVPAAPSFDCVSVLASTLTLAAQVTAIMTGTDPADVRSRAWPAEVRLAATERPVVLLPDAAPLQYLSPAARQRFAEAASRLETAGCQLQEVDFSLFFAAAELLYESAIVAERTASYGHLLDPAHPDTIPVVAEVAAAGAAHSAVDYLGARARLNELRVALAPVLASADALLVPTTTRHPSIAEALADPAGVNRELGSFTNFCNLLDLCAVAVPAGLADEGAFGATVLAKAFDDQVALDVAGMLAPAETKAPAASAVTVDSAAPAPLPILPPATALVVFGAHRTGQPLNHQLRELGARYAGPIQTTPQYRMFELGADSVAGLPPRPGVVQTEIGRALKGEKWLLSPAALGQFLAGLAAPQALGPIHLADGTTELGFLAASTELGQGPNLESTHDDWLTHLAATRPTTATPKGEK